MTNYIQDAIDLVSNNYDGDLDPEFAEVYALLFLMKGPFATLEDVHDAWAVVRNRTKPDHKSLVPFGELDPEVQALDQPFVDAIKGAASEYLGYDLEYLGYDLAKALAE